MATSEGFKDFVLEHLEHTNAEFGGTFTFSARKMFGEYCIYVNDSGVQKTLFLVCDEEIFVKKFAELSEFALQNEAHCSVGYPYEGAKEHYKVDIENTEFLSKLLQILVPLCPASKPKKHKKSKIKL